MSFYADDTRLYVAVSSDDTKPTDASFRRVILYIILPSCHETYTHL